MAAAHRSPLRTRLWRRLLRTRSFDGAMRRRAAELFDLGEIGKHLVAGGRYLDIGGGTGHMLERLLAEPVEALRAVGLDREWSASRHVVRRLAKKAAGRFEFGLADATRLPIGDGELDGVMLCFVLHHIAYPLHEHVLAELHRTVRRGGNVFLFEDTPADARQWRRTERWDRWLNMEPKSEPHFYRSGPAWIEFFAAHGFRCVQQRSFDEMSPRLPGNRVPHEALVFRAE